MNRISQQPPRLVPQVMVSSSFTDLKKHRAALAVAIRQHGLHANVMEDDSARLLDVIDSSLQMVRDSAAYIGVIGFKYGQTPVCPKRNPEGLSLTELEFNEALRLDRPILIFIMGDGHDIKKGDVETDPVKEEKLNDFRERAKKALPDAGVDRVYAVFESFDEFRLKIGPSLDELARHLEQLHAGNPGQTAPESGSVEDATVPVPPSLYARPRYIGSHRFVGRQAQLQELDDWARAADPTNFLLFEAIGGNGKSMLTWEWTTNHAPQVRTDWAGRFWYSFYEKGAVMADFCRCALAYMRGQSLESLQNKKTAELIGPLLAQLQARPWLVVLDGLERVLVAYHHIDAASMRDEEADRPTDRIASRNPCDAIRDEDNDLLRALAAVAPSKIVASTRLTPRVLLNASNQAIPGVRRIALPGLRPQDAELLLRSCGVSGDSESIQKYLSANCDNHPLVIGVLAGLINNHLPARGNFDAWSSDTGTGGRIDFAKLDLTQRRNHILRAALADLPAPAAQLLSTLALMFGAVDYETIKALNPHLPSAPEKVEKPVHPASKVGWKLLSIPTEKSLEKLYGRQFSEWQTYQRLEQEYLASPACQQAESRLMETVMDLERRGLLQYDAGARRHDMHPVVRGVSIGWLQLDQKKILGQRVVDYFSSQSRNSYSGAETLDELSSELHLFRALVNTGQLEKAFILLFELFDPLIFNMELHPETLALLQPFRAGKWFEPVSSLQEQTRSMFLNCAAFVLDMGEHWPEAFEVHVEGLRASLLQERWIWLCGCLAGLSKHFSNQNRIARSLRMRLLEKRVAGLIEYHDQIFTAALGEFSVYSRMGQWEKSEETWQLMETMGRDWPTSVYRPGTAELLYAWSKFFRGELQEEHLVKAEQLARHGKSRQEIRWLCQLRGDWHLGRQQWKEAIPWYQEALRMSRERGLRDTAAEVELALCKFHLNQLAEPTSEAERLSGLPGVTQQHLAELWLALGRADRAGRHALNAYEYAWADGEPYVRRFALNAAIEMLQRLNIPVPSLPSYDPAQDKKFDWELEVEAAIERLRQEKADKSGGDRPAGD